MASLAGAQTADLSRLVVVGDSLSAGVQNISLIGTQQVNGYAPLIAQQAGVPLVLPLIQYPGLPNVLQLDGFNPLPIIKPAPGTMPEQSRLDPNIQPTDLAEPGATVAAAFVPPGSLPPPVGSWASAVLQSSAYPNSPLSQIQEAVALKPTTVILWLGNNDALVPTVVGALSTLTPVSRADTASTNPLANFTDAFNLALGSLAQTGATLIVANIPDVTEIAFFTPVARIARLTFHSPETIATALGTDPGDYLRMSALQPAWDILTGKTKGPLPAVCPSPYAGFPAAQVPCVLTASDIAFVRARVDAYNTAIAAAVAKTPHATLVDIHALVDDISANGYQVHGRSLNTNLLGGIFTLDGIHPTNTGYAIMANFFIRTMNANLNTNIPAVNVKRIAKKDPFLFDPENLLHIF